jgi:hypothetical protein
MRNPVCVVVVVAVVIFLFRCIVRFLAKGAPRKMEGEGRRGRRETREMMAEGIIAKPQEGVDDVEPPLGTARRRRSVVLEDVGKGDDDDDRGRGGRVGGGELEVTSPLPL